MRKTPGVPDPDPTDEGESEGEDPQAAGRLAAAHEALARARRAARARGLRPGILAGSDLRRRKRVTGGKDGSRDARDPQPVGREVDKLVSSRGWDSEVQVGTVIGRWPVIVGPTVAAQVEVVAFEDTVLTVRASSTAWATQMRLLTSSVLGRIEAEAGPGVVTEIVVRGPAGPSWRKGPLSAGGRGPRDTYG